MNNNQGNNESIGKTASSVVLITALALLFTLLYLMLPVLSPVVVFLAVLYLLYPFRGNIFITRLMWMTGFLFVIWFSNYFIGVLSPFIVSFLIAYLLNPLVSLLEKRKISRLTSAILIMLVFVSLISLFIILIMPTILIQFRGIIENVSNFAVNTVDSLKQGAVIETLRRAGLPVDAIQKTIEKELPQRMEVILKSLLEGAFSFVTSITMVITQLLNIILIPFVTFYFLKDFPEILATIKSFFPKNKKEIISEYFKKVDDVLSDYFRGALIVAFIQGSISTIILSILGVKYAFVLGIMTMLLDFIPYVGLLISLIVASIVAMFSGDPATVKVIGVIVMYLVQKITENTILAPKIIGEKVGLHPIILMISLFIFGYLFGFVGLLIAVPTTAIIVMSIKLWQANNLEGNESLGKSA
jgi:predicted PurR-regulated permease PerM